MSQINPEDYGGIWGEYPEYPVNNWKEAVANESTRMGYWAWVNRGIAQDPGVMVIGDEYTISFSDPNQPDYTSFHGSAVFVGLDPEDYGTGESHGHFRMKNGTITSFPLKSVIN